MIMSGEVSGDGQALTARSNGSLTSAMSRWAKRLAAGGKGASPIPAEGHGTRDRWIAKRITATLVLGTGSGIGMSVVPSPASTRPWTIVKSSPS